MFEAMIEGRTAKRNKSSLVHRQYFANGDSNEPESPNPLDRGNEEKGQRVELLQCFG